MKLDSKGKALIRLVLWSGLMVWMLFYLALGIVMARRLGSLNWSGGLLGDVLRWVAPIWIVFTVLLTIVLIARWAFKKLGKKVEVR